MSRVGSFRKSWIFFIPGLYFFWSWILLRIERPFFLSRIDPEYIHLLNGLNCAILNFNRIGHVDNPGTPFQVLSGFFIRMIHSLLGRDNIIDDVLQHSEIYLTLMSVFLAVMTTGTLIWLGRLLWKYQIPFIQVAVVQSSLLISTVLIDLPARYTPDRLLSILAMVLVGFCLKYLYETNFTGKQFATYAGIFTGIGLVTKLTFAPFLIFPWVILHTKKNKFRYAVVLFLSMAVCFLPIHRRIRDLYYFVKSLILHDELYGQGQNQIFNLSNLKESLLYAVQHHWLVWLLLIPVAIVLLYGWSDRYFRKKHNLQYKILIAIALVFLLTFLMLAKHYKNYYTIPILCLIPFGYFLVMNMSREIFAFKKTNYFFAGFFLFILMIPIYKTSQKYIRIQGKNEPYYATASFINNQISPTDYFLIEPTWASGPMVENGLVFGFSYVRHLVQYYNHIERFYPNILTWEGEDAPLSYFRMIEAVNETILKSGKNIHLLSTPDRNAQKLSTYLENQAEKYDLSLKKDTIYKNTELDLQIIRFSHLDSWDMIIHTRCGFEKRIGNKMMTDDQKFKLDGSYKRYSKKKMNGKYALLLSPEHRQTPGFSLTQVMPGDFLEVTIKRKRSPSKVKGNLELFYVENGEKVILSKGAYVDLISKGWELIRLNTEMRTPVPAGLLNIAYHFPGESEEIVDDLSIRLCRKTK